LLYGLKAKGKHAIGMKPIASGCVETADGLLSEDALALTAASSRQLAIREVNPYAFVPAIAPHVAANAAGLTIEVDRIVESFGAVAARCDIVVVEGVGGFRVPLNEREDTADLAVRLQLPIVLVVGMRLGCLNHALLTVEAIGARGLTLAGWVANGIDAKMQMFEENVASLRQRISSPCLGVIAFDPQVSASTVRGERFCETLLKPMGVC
jgi:dethiobiotin synthetase